MPEPLYRRRSITLYPPVDVERFALQTIKHDYYLTASRTLPYKRIELVAEAFTAMPEKRLIIIGEEPEHARIKSKCGPNVTLAGPQPVEKLVEYMRYAKAFVFAAEEDFGIVPVEAQACGTPVIAFGRGGVTESVVDGKTGVFFNEQTAASICEALKQFEREGSSFDPAAIRAHAQKFNTDRFCDELLRLVADEWVTFNSIESRTPPDVSPNFTQIANQQGVRLRGKVASIETRVHSAPEAPTVLLKA